MYRIKTSLLAVVCGSSAPNPLLKKARVQGIRFFILVGKTREHFSTGMATLLINEPQFLC